jgi:hypothetical protein
LAQWCLHTRLLLVHLLQVPKPLDPQELDQLKQQIASELHAQLAASSGGKELTPEQLAQVGSSGQSSGNGKF